MRILNKFSDITYALILKLNSTYDLSILAPIFFTRAEGCPCIHQGELLKNLMNPKTGSSAVPTGQLP